MVTRSQAFPSKYFCGDDVAKPLVVEVQHCGIEPLKNKDGVTSDKLIVYFSGQKKALVCNRTNWDAIVEITNEDDTDLWVGHRICLFASPERVAGKMMNCVRVRSASAPVKATPPKKAASTFVPPKMDDVPPSDIPDDQLEQMAKEAAERGNDDIEF